MVLVRVYGGRGRPSGEGVRKEPVMSGSKTTHAKFRVSVLVTSVVVGVASLAQLPARPTSAAAATLSGSKGPGPSESSGRIPARCRRRRRWRRGWRRW